MSVIRIAICDDHPVFRAGMVSVINEHEDFDVVVEAGSVDELNDRLSGTPVDVVLLDIELPGRDGLSALPELVREHQVLVFSAFDDARTVKQAMESGAVGFVRKDADSANLIAALREAAAGRTVLDHELAMRVAQSLRAEPDAVAFRRKVADLTSRQREVLALLAQGKSNRDISDALFVSEGTVNNHVTRILHALQMPDRTKLAVMLIRHNVEV
ncbi:MAG: response regulator transcription factor [Chrysiogenetes bacterium]|nr:response regulator transcription factor [Chrysiogenetes bacterium]